MQHFFGIDIGTSFEFQDKIRTIGQQISQKKAARMYFGNRPFVTPEKNAFFLKKDEENEIVLINIEGTKPMINLTVRHNQESKGSFDEITKLTQEISEIICNQLGVEIMKIGSVFEIISDVNDRFQVYQDKFVPSLLPKLTAVGGFTRYIYEITIPKINKECYINIDIDVNRTAEKILIKLDINNKDIHIGMVPGEVIGIGEYSFDFLYNELNVLLKSKGLNIDESYPK